MTDETAPHSNRPVLWFDAILAEEHPEIMAAAKSVRDELGLYFATYSDSRKADARLTALLVQALNDIADLLDEVVHLKGRPALRTARALVEHLLNLAHASSTPEEATRFAEHAVVVALLEAELKIGAGQLSSRDRRSYVDRMERLEREARPYYDKAIAKYGSKFRTSWTSLNAADRADQYGHSDLYGFYRLASKVVHGSAGGTLGLFDGEMPATGGPVVMRIGPSAEAAVLAFHQGFEAALRFVATFDTWLDRQQPSRLATELEALLGHWSKYRALAQAVDAVSWDSDGPPEFDSACVEIVYPLCTLRWWIHREDRAMLVEAQPPDYIPPWVHEIAATARSTRPHEPHPAFVKVPGLLVEPVVDGSTKSSRVLSALLRTESIDYLESVRAASSFVLPQEFIAQLNAQTSDR